MPPGAALCRRFAELGAKRVVVADLSEEGFGVLWGEHVILIFDLVEWSSFFCKKW